MPENRWPIRVDQISITNKYMPLFNKKDVVDIGSEPGGIGIISRESLIGILTNISHQIGIPVEIIEFNRNKEDAIYRIKGLPVYLPEFPNKICEIYQADLREDAICDEAIKRFALLFRYADINNFMEHIENKYENDFSYFKKFHILKKQLDISEVPRIEYSCPIFGFRKFIFPLFFEGEVIGCLSFGRFILYEDKEQIRFRYLYPFL